MFMETLEHGQHLWAASHYLWLILDFLHHDRFLGICVINRNFWDKLFDMFIDGPIIGSAVFILLTFYTNYGRTETTERDRDNLGYMLMREADECMPMVARW